MQSSATNQSNHMKQIKLNSGKVIVTDPLYEPSNGFNATLQDILQGMWNCEVETKSIALWGKRISSLTIRHEDYPNCCVQEHETNVCVDTGQCGFFSADYYEKNQPDDDCDNPQSWYRRVCELTLNEPKWGTIDDDGVVAASGLGDGCYDVYVKRNSSGYIVGIKLKFI